MAILLLHSQVVIICWHTSVKKVQQTMQEVIRSQLAIGYSKSKVMPLLIFCLSLIKMEFSGPSTQVKTTFNFLQCGLDLLAKNELHSPIAI